MKVHFLTFCTSVGCNDCQFVGLFKLSGLDVTFAFGVLEKLYDYAWLHWKCFACWPGWTLSPVESDIVLREEIIHYDASLAGSKGIER